MCFLRLYWLSTFIPLPSHTHKKGSPIGAGEAPEAIVISDTNLSAAIRSTLGLAEDATLTATAMLNLMSLEAHEGRDKRPERFGACHEPHYTQPLRESIDEYQSALKA